MTKPQKNLKKRLERLVHFDEVFPEKLKITLTPEEITGQLLYKTGYDLYLNAYTKDEIREVLIRRGIWESIKNQGFQNIILQMDCNDPFHQRLCLYYDKISPAHLLAQIILSTGTFVPRKHFLKSFKIEKMDMLIIEWLCLQNPLKSFTPDKPRLPGQDYPGLGIGRKTVELIQMVAMDLEKDGILNYPQYYHNAVMYSEIFKFYNPVLYGRMLAIKELLKDFTFADSAWIVHTGCVEDQLTRKKFVWKAEEMILPLKNHLKEYFASSEYQQMVNETIAKARFVFNYKKYEKLKQKVI